MPYDRITQAAIDVVTGKSPNNLRLRDAIEAKHPGALARGRERLKRERWEAKFSGNPPAWAKRYVEKHQRSLSKLAWHHTRYGGYHGTCTTGWGDEISITVPYGGDDTDDARVLVLHELAHAEAPYGSGHGDRFYEEWARLLKAEGLYRAAMNTVFAGSRRNGALRAASRRLKAKAAAKAA